MGKRKTTTISLLTLSIIGMTAFTSGHLPKSSSFSPTYALAQPAGPVAKSFEKYNGGKEKFVEELKKELSDNTSELRIWELGMPTFKDQNISISDLASKIPDGYTAVKVNGQLHHQKVVFIVKNEDILVNDQAEYEAKTKELSQKVGTFGVHSLFDLKKDNYLDIILGSNGLRKTLENYNGINGLTLYSNTLGLANTYTEQYENSKITLEKIQNNDKELLKMLKESGAAHAPTEREKVKRWVVYLKKKIPYDFDALKVYRTDRKSYNISSDLFAVATRKKAMCVGYSIATARAMNLLGLPSYMVEGVTEGGALHATTRVFFDNAWHLVDSTGGGADENQSEYYYDFYFNNSLDQYKNVTQAEENRNDRNYMVINKEFEEWAKGQSTAKLLYVNADVALRERVPFIVSQEIKEKLKTANEKLKTDFDKLRENSNTAENFKNTISNLMSSIDEDLEKLDLNKVATEEDYKNISSTLSSNITFYKDLQKAINHTDISIQLNSYENEIEQIKHQFEKERDTFIEKNKEVLDKNKDIEEKAQQEEAEYLARRSQRSSTILTFEERQNLKKKIQEESKKLDNTMSEAAKREVSPTEQARTVSAASSTSSRGSQATREENPKRAKRSLTLHEPAVSPTPARPAPVPAKTASEPALHSQPTLTPRSTHPAQPQSRARVGAEPRRSRTRRSVDNPGTEATPAPARPAPAPAPQARKDSAPVSEPVVAAPRAPRTPASAQPQSHYRNPNLENRVGRFSRLFSNQGTESTPAPARPAPAPVSQPTPVPARPAATSGQGPNAQPWYHSQYWRQPEPYSPRFNYSSNHNYSYNYK